MKLAVEAGYNKDRWTTTEQFEQFLEQYGKLIVKECANIAEYADGNWPADQIKMHFGMEK